MLAGVIRWLVLPLALWTAAVAGLFYWLQRVPPEEPCADVILRQASCAAPEPMLEGHWVTTYGVAILFWAAGILMGDIVLRLYRRSHGKKRSDAPAVN